MTRKRGQRTIGRVIGVVAAAFAVAGLSSALASTASVAETTTTASSSAAGEEQRFVPNVVGAFNGLSTRGDALAFRRGTSPEAGLCTHYQGIARKESSDGTPYLFITKSGNVPTFCEIGGGDDHDGYLIVVRMGSRGKHGERLGRNLYPYDDRVVPTGDRAVTTIALDGQDGRPGYRHPGGMQILGDVLVIGAEERRFLSHPRAALLFFDVSDPENPRFIKQWSPPALDEEENEEFGADPVGLTAIKAPDGACCRYLMIVAGGPANRDVRFFRSLADPGATTTTLDSQELDWEEVGRYTGTWITVPNPGGGPPIPIFVPELNCSGAQWPTGLGTQHQTFNFVREGSLDGRLYMLAMLRDGAVVNPFADEDEYIDLYEVNISADGTPAACPLTRVSRKRVGLDGLGPALQSWGEFQDIGSFAAGSGAHVTPSGELLVYVTDHEDTFLGEYRPHSLVRANSPTLRPTAVVDGPFAVDEGSSVGLTGSGAPAITKAFVQLFSGTGAGVTLDDDAWLTVEYGDREADHFDALCRLNLGGFPFSTCVPNVTLPLDPIADKVSSWRWFAPPGCTIQANDFPRFSDEFPGPDSVRLRGTGQFVEVHNLSGLQVYQPGDSPSPYPVSPVPAGQTATTKNVDNDVEGVMFHEAYRVNGTLVSDHRGCDGYYSAPIGLGWDLDDNGVFESSGSPVSFSAAALDGPSTATVRARATHPTDTSPTGTGAPIAVSIEVLNVAPVITAAAVTDSLGRNLAGGTHVALAGLPVTLDIRFTDPGRADTQSGSVDWGDGTPLDTSFASFSHATGGVTGQLEDARAYAAPGTYTITATITDDDGGATPTSFTIEVLSLEDAIEHVADELTALIAAATDARVKAALQAARDQLIGNLGGTPPTNGALDKLDADDPVGAITKLRAAISYLQTAEARGAGDLSALKDLLGLVAEGIATVAYHDAQAAVSPPSTGQEKTLAVIASLIQQGHTQLGSGQYLKACDSFRQATQKALDLTK